MQRAGEQAGMNLITVSSHRSARTALRDAETLVREQVDLVIEFQSHERVAPTIAARFLAADIPVIAIEIPHPGATFFGANNHQAGLLGGRAAARWVKQHCGRVGSILLIEESGGAAGKTACERHAGGLAGTAADTERSDSRDGRARIDGPYARCRTAALAQYRRGGLSYWRVTIPWRWARSGHSRKRPREQLCAMGQNASWEGRDELRRGSRR